MTRVVEDGFAVVAAALPKRGLLLRELDRILRALRRRRLTDYDRDLRTRWPGLYVGHVREIILDVTHRAPRLESVRCWKCGCDARRVTYKLQAVVGRSRLVRAYGVCPRVHVRFADGGVSMCGGVMLRSKDRVYVLRAALAHERAGRNRSSEYDG